LQAKGKKEISGYGEGNSFFGSGNTVFPVVLKTRLKV
jgi:hypothetical protein